MAEMKPHLALTVSDVERSVPFYRALLDAEPAKVKPGYAKFEPPDPAIVLALIQGCLLYTSPSPRDGLLSRMPSSA